MPEKVKKIAAEKFKGKKIKKGIWKKRKVEYVSGEIIARAIKLGAWIYSQLLP